MDDYLVDTKVAIRIANISRSHWHDIHDEKSPRFDPTAPKKIKLSPRVARYWHSEVVAWIVGKGNGAKS